MQEAADLVARARETVADCRNTCYTASLKRELAVSRTGPTFCTARRIFSGLVSSVRAQYRVQKKGRLVAGPLLRPVYNYRSRCSWFSSLSSSLSPSLSPSRSTSWT